MLFNSVYHLCLHQLVSLITLNLNVFQEAQVYADDNSLLFLETSAKTALNVNEVFLAIGKSFIIIIIILVIILIILTSIYQSPLPGVVLQI